MNNYLQKRIASFGYAFRGMATLLKGEPNAVIHLIVLAGMVVLGFLFGITAGEWMAVIIISGMVLMAEALNSAIEKLSDVVSPTIHPGIKKVKDLSAAAVLFAALAELIVGLMVFAPKILNLL